MILKGIWNFPSTRDRVIFGHISVLITLIWPLAPTNLSTGDPWMTLSHGKPEKWIPPNLNWNCKVSLIFMTTHAKSRVFGHFWANLGDIKTHCKKNSPKRESWVLEKPLSNPFEFIIQYWTTLKFLKSDTGDPIPMAFFEYWPFYFIPFKLIMRVN